LIMRTTTRAVALLAAALTLGGCTQVVPFTPAEDATNPACADVIVHLPETVAGLEQRETDAQATSAWGAPADIRLRCGVPVPGPTATLPCVPDSVDGVDWLFDDSDDPVHIFITYGRDPAIEVIVNSETVSDRAALTDLASAVKLIPATRSCVSLEDVEP
jgi:hypothetical protein